VKVFKNTCSLKGQIKLRLWYMYSSLPLILANIQLYECLGSCTCAPCIPVLNELIVLTIGTPHLNQLFHFARGKIWWWIFSSFVRILLQKKLLNLLILFASFDLLILWMPWFAFTVYNKCHSKSFHLHESHVTVTATATINITHNTRRIS